MSLLQLPKALLEKITAKNNFLKAFHKKTLLNTWLITTLDAKPLANPSFSANFIFEEAFELTLKSEQLPFVALMEEWSKPWLWHELSESLAHALLEEVLNHYNTTLPKTLRLNSFSLNATLENNNLEHFACQLSSLGSIYRLDVYAKNDFPFDRLSKSLALNFAQKKPYPKELYINLPIKLISTTLPIKDIKTLDKGDIILIHSHAP